MVQQNESTWQTEAQQIGSWHPGGACAVKQFPVAPSGQVCANAAVANEAAKAHPRTRGETDRTDRAKRATRWTN
ncbi:MAG: hypothetical protein EBR10_00320 [Planctomycetes bacterium]|nr:hypothetical protein [Planctomycetota bacterium]